MTSQRFFLSVMVLLWSISSRPLESAALGQDKSRAPRPANIPSISTSSEPTRASVAEKLASETNTSHVLKKTKPNGPHCGCKKIAKSSTKFAEAEILLSDQFSIEHVCALPIAPGSDLEVLDNPGRVRVQLAASELKALRERGAEITLLRKFVLVKGAKAETIEQDGSVTTAGSCSGSYCYGESSANVAIPDNGGWVYGEIVISEAPACAEVASIDVHYEITHTCVGNLILDLSNEEITSEYRLWDKQGGDTDDVDQTDSDITEFNGEIVNQAWLFWAQDTTSRDTGYIDYWWIKVYYEDVASPPNDDCKDAIVVNEAVAYNGSTCGARGTDQSSSGDKDTTDVWHYFKATSEGNFRISLCGSQFDTTLAIFDDCGGTELTANDDSCDLQSEVVVALAEGQSCLIRIAGYEGDGGSYTLAVEKCQPPKNDECVNAIPVTDGAAYYGSTDCAAATDESSCADNDTSDVWHSYTPASTGLATINLAGSAFDTTLTVFDGCGGKELACNDDSCGDLQSEITMLMTEGNTYLIRVAGYDAASGDYTLTVNSSPHILSPEPNNPSPADGAADVPLDTVLSWNKSGVKASSARSDRASMPITKGIMVSKVIYGDDDRLDEYQIEDEDILAAGDSTVIFVPESFLTDNKDGTFSLLDWTLAQWYEQINPIGTGNPLCDDEPFRDQPAPGVCSGFLVAADIIATAGHCAWPSDCRDTAIVFGFVVLDANTSVLTIDETDIYYCREVIARQEGHPDWALIRLDREVTGHSPSPMRTAGIVPDDEPLLVIGYPYGLPRKYAAGATVRDNTASTHFQANLDTYEGSSGSVVLNVDTLDVEGILYSGHVDFVEDGSCDRSIVCPDDTGCPDWEDVTRATEFSALIPSFDVHLGTNPKQLDLICSDVVVPWCEPGPLEPGTTYYWKVVAKNHCGQTEGPVWSFTTKECFPSAYSTYNDWVALGRPNCWCGIYGDPPCPHQCDGDADCATETFFEYRIYGNDLKLVVENWKRPPEHPDFNPCADIDHKPETFFEYRVYGKDLATVVTNWKKKDADLPDNCPRPE